MRLEVSHRQAGASGAAFVQPIEVAACSSPLGTPASVSDRRTEGTPRSRETSVGRFLRTWRMTVSSYSSCSTWFFSDRMGQVSPSVRSLQW